MKTPEQKAQRRAIYQRAVDMALVRETLRPEQCIVVDLVLRTSKDDMAPLMSPLTDDPNDPIHLRNWKL